MKIFLKAFASLLLAAVVVFCVFSVSPVYDFKAPHSFEGPDIFDPYEHVDTALGWKKANFHTHTRVKGPLNECKYWPSEVLQDYEALGYDILTFSNHNELTEHPVSDSLQVNVYEHGYGLCKYHKLVFGCSRVMHFDHLLPLLASQRQWQLDILERDADFIQLNHPFRTLGTSQPIMEALEGYRVIELDSGVSTENEYWDWALSAGHYSFALANDDCHDSRTSSKIAVRANFLNTPSARYEDLKTTLLQGGYYCMRIPDFGAGDWEVKREHAFNLPRIRTIGLQHDSVITMTLDRAAKYIKVTGAGHRTLDSLACAHSIEYVMPADEPYARLTAFFDDGCVIYTNAFARFDKTKAPTPYSEPGHSVNIALTLLFNAMLAVLIALALCALRFLWGSVRR